MANSEFIEAWIERLRIEPRRKATEVAEKLKNYCHSETGFSRCGICFLRGECGSNRTPQSQLVVPFYRLTMPIRLQIMMIQPAVPPLPLLVLRNPFQQMHAAKIRPQRRSHPHLRIRQLPQP